MKHFSSTWVIHKWHHAIGSDVFVIENIYFIVSAPGLSTINSSSILLDSFNGVVGLQFASLWSTCMIIKAFVEKIKYNLFTFAVKMQNLISFCYLFLSKIHLSILALATCLKILHLINLKLFIFWNHIYPTKALTRWIFKMPSANALIWIFWPADNIKRLYLYFTAKSYFQNNIQRQVVNFINVLQAAFTPAD
jgi:hypothetical protein